VNLNKWSTECLGPDQCIYCGSNRLSITKKTKEDYAEQVFCNDCEKKMMRWTMKEYKLGDDL